MRVERRMREEKRAREARERQQREQEAAERRADVANEGSGAPRRWPASSTTAGSSTAPRSCRRAPAAHAVACGCVDEGVPVAHRSACAGHPQAIDVPCV